MADGTRAGVATDVFDYLIIGGGSAGCVVANRLVTAGKSVLLLEAGPVDSDPFIHIPATFVRVIGSRRTWMYRTEPDPGTEGRSLVVPQGRTLGGGSSVNAMIYIRGQTEDYDGWRDLGCPGWSYDEVLPVFRRSEGNERLSNAFHGAEGPLRVSDLRHRHPLSLAFIRAAQEAGLPYNDDFNGVSQAGVGFYQTTIADGRRGSTAATFLKAVRHSPHLTVRTECLVTGLVLENGAATGARYRAKDGSTHLARAKEEVILCAGALASCKILMLSGIGPAAELTRHAIPVLRDLPGVGENFQDHITASVYGVTDRPISLLGQDKGWRAARNGLHYLLTRSGLLASNVVESGAFIDTGGTGRPDIQIHVTPALVGDAERKPLGQHGISINPCVLRPTSRGRVTLRSPDAADPIVFTANNLATREDVDTLVRGLRIAQRILRAPSLQAQGLREWAPGPDDDLSDAALESHARRFAKTVYHPSGTCKMGRDAMAVVDEKLRVHGVPRLRVADASIMPTLVSGNTNAPCVMIGERCADFVLAAGG
ncbi:GMC family oxidoreductase [Labrys neptuniae]